MPRFTKTKAVLATAVVGAAMAAGTLSSPAYAAPIEGAGELAAHPFFDWNGNGTQDEGERFGVAAAVSFKHTEITEDPDGPDGPMVVAGGQGFSRFTQELDENGKPVFDPTPPDDVWGTFSTLVPGTYDVWISTFGGCDIGTVKGFEPSDEPLGGQPVETIFSTKAKGTVEIVAGETVDIGAVPVVCDPIDLTANVFEDTNANGALDVDEAGVAGADVTLDGYTSRSWVLDLEDPKAADTVMGVPHTVNGATDEAGTVNLAQLEEGTYDLSVTLPDGCTIAEGAEVPAQQTFEWGDSMVVDVPVTCEVSEETTTTTSTTQVEETTTTVDPDLDPVVGLETTTTVGYQAGPGVQVNTGSSSGTNPVALGLGGLTLAGACAGAVALYRRRLI